MEVRNGNFRIKTDEYNWMFQEFKGMHRRKKSADPTESWDTWGYYPNLEQLLKATTDRLLRRAPGDAHESIGEMVGILRPILAEIKSAQEELMAMT